MKELMIFAFILFLSIGCVGTVEEAKQNYSKINDAPVSAITFAGIFNAVAISDSRIEVFFYPASGGSGKYTYDILVGNSPFPASIPSDVLKPDFRGLLKYTVSGLDRLTSVMVKVEVRDKNSDIQSNSRVIKEVTTFDNMVADFNGISSASNTPGQDGKDSIKVRWTPARTSGGLSKKEWDPKSYEIVIVDAEKLTPNDMDVTTYGPADGRYVFGLNHDSSVNEYIVRGLPSERRFYVRMRAIHENSVYDMYNPRKRSELNTNYVTIATLSSDLADLDFQTDSFAVALAPGEQGLNAISASWIAAKGVFDHYRIYYSEEGGGVASGRLTSLCLSPFLSPVGETVYCKKADFKTTTTPVTGLKPYTKYEMVLVLCATSSCLPAERVLAPVRTILTDPNTPTFNGLREILVARSLDELGNLYLKFDPPNFSNGYFDGLIIKMRRTQDNTGGDVEVTTGSNPVFNLNYNFLSENQITLRGIDYLTTDPYCFTLYPFKWDNDGITRREFPNDVWKCVTPKPEASTAEQFAGLGAGYTEDDRVTLLWDAPSSGVFTYYELFWNKQPGGNFNWGDAIGQAGNNFNFSNFGRKLITPDQTSTVLSGFSNGEYTFGMITYFTYVTDDGNVVLRSETNTGIKKCTIDHSKLEPTNCL